MAERIVGCLAVVFIVILFIFMGTWLFVLGYDAITGDWKQRVIEVNNPEMRVVCFSGPGDKTSSCYPYELLDPERVKKYEAKK